MEQKLQKLIKGNSEQTRMKHALLAKHQGQKVIGILGSHVPEEVIYAAGMFPWRVTGSWRSDVHLAKAYRHSYTCSYCTHILDYLLSGELDFLDGIVTTNLDHDMVRLYDVWAHIGKTPFTHIMSLPHQDSELARRQFQKEIGKLMVALGEFGGVQISEDALGTAINIYNLMRDLLMKVYQLRKKTKPPVSGAEALGITTTAQIMPKEEFNQELNGLLPFLQSRETALNHLHPRVLVSSEMLDNPAFFKIIEDAGCLIAMDDLDTGSRYFWHNVDTGLSEPSYALSEYYITRPGCPRMSDWEKQIDQTLQWAYDYKIDGVLELTQAYCWPRLYRSPILNEKLTSAGIPFMSIERDYTLTMTGQLRTRIQAFIEILESRISQSDGVRASD